MYIQAADYTCTTKLHHTLCTARVKTEAVQQNLHCFIFYLKLSF